jgi:sarcosine oxidase subunit alpha
MWPRAWNPCTSRSSAAPPAGRAPTRPDPDRYAQRYAHCDVLVVGADPRVSPPRWPPRRRRRARHAVRRAVRIRRQPAGRCRRPHRRRDRRCLGAAHRSRHCGQSARHPAPAHHRLRLLPAQSHRPERAPHRSSGSPAAHLPRERLWQVRARRWCSPPAPSSGRWCFRATIARHHAGGRRADLSESLRRRVGRHARGHRDRGDAAYQTALDLQAAGVWSPPSPMCAPQCTGALPEAARRAGIDVLRDPRCSAPRAICASSAIALGEVR